MTLANSPTFTTLVNNCTATASETIPVFQVNAKDLDRTYRLVVAHQYLKYQIVPVILNTAKIFNSGSVADAMNICGQLETPISLQSLIDTANAMDGWTIEASGDGEFRAVFLSYVEKAIEDAKISLTLDFGSTFDPSTRMLSAAAVIYLRDRLLQMLAEAKRILDQSDIDATLRVADQLGLRYSIDSVLFHAARYAEATTLN